MVNINITKEANNYLKKVLNNKKALGISITVISSGCSGKSYNLDLFYKQNEIKGYLSLSINDIKFVIEKKDILYFNGLKIDFIKEQFSEKIVFINEKAYGQCGCGESFNLIKQENE